MTERRRHYTGPPGVEEAAVPRWVGTLDTPGERGRVRRIAAAEDAERRGWEETRLEESRAFLQRRGDAAGFAWPLLAPLRVEMLSLQTSSERTEEGEPCYVEAQFLVTLNDPARTQLRLPVRVSATDAAAPGRHDEMDGAPRSPDYLFKAWYALARFGRLLQAVAHAGCEKGPADTPTSHWLETDDLAEEDALLRTGPL